MTSKRTQVVMLPTNEKAIRPLLVNPSTGKMETTKHEYNYSAKEYQNVGYKTYHLYFLSDEKIKDDDWFMDITPMNYGKIYKSIGLSNSKGYENWVKSDTGIIKEPITQCKKIIATTDSSLKISKFSHYSQDLMKIAIYKDYLTPQPSQDFIKVFVEEYNKGNIIEWVDVEYEDFILNQSRIGLPNIIKNKIKVNSKNEITIRKIKDSWNREEVIKLLKQVDKHVSKYNHYFTGVNDWISENL